MSSALPDCLYEERPNAERLSRRRARRCARARIISSESCFTAAAISSGRTDDDEEVTNDVEEVEEEESVEGCAECRAEETT